MNTRRRLRLSSLCVLAMGLLLAAPSSGSQTTNTSRSTQRSPDASLILIVDRNGFAKINFWLTTKLDDPSKVRQALQQSLSFPLKFDERSDPAAQDDFEQAVDDMAEDPSWTFVKGRSERSLSNQGMKSTTRITFMPLINELRSAGVKRLSIGIMFEDPDAQVTLAGGTRVGSGSSQLNLNYYHAEINLDAPTTSAIEFSYGYSPTDIGWRTLPLLALVLFPALLTLLIRHSVLKVRDQPAQMWGRYFHFWQLLLGFIWLLWIPVCGWTGLSEVLMFVVGRDRRLTVHVLNMGLYLLPPLLSLCLCHLLSKPVYDRVTGVEWSPRDVMRKAIVTTAITLFPLFVIVIVIGMFNLGSRFTGLFLIVAGMGWLLSVGLINRIFKSSVQAITGGEFRNRVFELAHKAGVPVKQIYMLPESTSQLSNAFARGDNSVMITASLLKHLSKREVDGIMAHEIGHLKEKHPQTRGHITLGAMIVTTIVASSLSSLINVPRSGPALFSFALLASMLILHFVSRSNERHADAIGISLTGDPEAFISGLAKLSRLNLMPLKSGGWGESLETHPRTMNRLQDIAKLHGIPEQRFHQLLDGSATVESGYATINADELSAKAFSAAFKKKHHTRVVLVLLGSLLILPVVISLLLAQISLPGVALWPMYSSGVFITFLLYLMEKNFVIPRGYRRLGQAIRAKLDQQGYAEVAREGILVGMAPAGQTRKYENYLFWDAGLLWLTADKLHYIGEEMEFALAREQIAKVYSQPSRAEWLSGRSLFIEWHDEDRKVTNAIYFLTLGAGSITKERRQLEALHDKVRAWLDGSEIFPEITPRLQSQPAPAFPAITSELANDRFDAKVFLKGGLSLATVSGLLSFAFRLSFAGACYSMAVLFLVMLLDELPKIGNRRPIKERLAIDPVPSEVTAYTRGAWAESNPATSTPQNM